MRRLYGSAATADQAESGIVDVPASNSRGGVFSISFMFRPGAYDEDFHRLDNAIAEIAKGTGGFLGSEVWVSPDGKTRNAVYYWSDLARLQDFAQALEHREAKANYSRWYDAYQVVVAEIRSVYGDGRLEHVTAPIARISPVGRGSARATS